MYPVSSHSVTLSPCPTTPMYLVSALSAPSYVTLSPCPITPFSPLLPPRTLSLLLLHHLPTLAVQELEVVCDHALLTLTLHLAVGARVEELTAPEVLLVQLLDHLQGAPLVITTVMCE